MGRVLRRAVGGLLVVCLVATAVAFYTYSPYLNLPAGNRSTGPAEQRPPISGAPSVTTTSSSPVPSPSPPAPEPDPADPGGRQPGIRLVVTVDADRVFEVIETVRLPVAVSSVALAPPDLRAAGGDLRTAHPYATGLVVQADGTPVRLSGRTVRSPTTVALGRRTDRVEIRYRLHDAIRLSRPSSAGRALGAVAPLLAGVSGDLPVAASFRGQAVSNVSCVRLPAPEQTCFGGERPHVRVDQNLAYRDALVQLQLDLLAASGEGPR